MAAVDLPPLMHQLTLKLVASAGARVGLGAVVDDNRILENETTTCMLASNYLSNCPQMNSKDYSSLTTKLQKCYDRQRY